jgi:hypothetical protein
MIDDQDRTDLDAVPIMQRDALRHYLPAKGRSILAVQVFQQGVLAYDNPRVAA